MNFNHESDMWKWRDNYCLGDDPDVDISECLLSKGEDISFMFDDENTPVKSCGDLTHHVSSYENKDKEIQRYNESSSQVKRRRMLQFESEVPDTPLCNEELSSSFLNSQDTENSVEEFIVEMSQWVSGFSEDLSSSGNEGLDQSSEGWLASCFNDSGMHLSPEDIAAADIQVDVSADICNTPPECESNVVRERPVKTRKNVVFKGRKSYMRAPPKVSSSVVYPFAFVKPCGVQGDVTLKDINQRIRTPQSKTAQNSVDPAVAFPKSAFSGKPVVGKTTIHTEGGKGSITIMRTKG